MIRVTATVLTMILLTIAAPAWAADEGFTGLSFFYPLVTRRPVVERELELNVRHEKTREGRVTEMTGAIEWPVLPQTWAASSVASSRRRFGGAADCTDRALLMPGL